MVTEGAPDILHQRNGSHIADQQDNLQDTGKDRLGVSVVRIQPIHMRGKRLVQPCRHNDEQSDGKRQRQHDADYRHCQHQRRSLFVFAAILAVGRRFGDRLFRRGFRVGLCRRCSVLRRGIGRRDRLGTAVAGCRKGSSLLRSLPRGAALCLFAAHLLLCILQSGYFGRAHQAPITEYHAVRKIEYAADDRHPPGPRPLAGGSREFLQHNLPARITHRHGGKARTAHHNALHECLTTDGCFPDGARSLGFCLIFAHSCPFSVRLRGDHKSLHGQHTRCSYSTIYL